MITELPVNEAILSEADTHHSNKPIERPTDNLTRAILLYRTPTALNVFSEGAMATL